MNQITHKMLDDIELSIKIFLKNVESLISIHEDTQELRERKVLELDQEVKEWSEENTGRKLNDIDNLRGDWLEEYFHYKHHFDYLLLHSLFISIFSMFESHMKRTVEILVYGLEPNIKPTDMKGNGEIDTLRKYLYLVINLDKASGDYVEWSEILEYKAIRNALVHSGCLLNKDKKENLDKVKGYKKVVEHDIWFSSDAIYLRIRDVEPHRGFYNVASKFVKGIYNELKNKA